MVQVSAGRALGPLALFAALAMVGTLLVLALQHEAGVFERRVQAELRRQSQSGIGATGELLRRTLDHVGTLQALGALAHLQAEAGDSAGAEPLRAHMRDVTASGMAGVLQVAVIGRDGRLTWSTVPDFAPVDLSDREHFRVHAEGMRGPFVSAPLVGRASGRASIQITRGIWDAGGAFRGVVVVSLDPMAMSRALGRANPADDSVVTLVRLDGTVLARCTDTAAMLGRYVSEERMGILTMAPQGAGEARSSLTGEERYIAWKRVDGWPLILVHGVSLAPGQAEVAAHRRAVILNGLAVVAVIVLALALIATWASNRQAAAAAQNDRQSRRRLQQLVESLPAGAYHAVLGPGGDVRCIQAGPVLAHITGDSAARDWGHLVHEHAQRAELLHRVAAFGQAMAEYRLDRPDGRAVYVRDEARLLCARESGQIEIVGLLSDVTAERDLRAQAMTNAKLATLGEMATGLAHEMNQPATAITLAADIVDLELGRLGVAIRPDIRARVTQIAEQATRIRDLIDHIRIFGRSDAPGRPPESLAPAEIVEGARTLTQASLHAAGVALRVEVEAELPAVLGHRVALEQVLVNLLLNARDALEDKGPGERTITLRAWAPDGKDEVAMSVEDNGPGFAPGVMDRAFEPFFTTKPQGKGTGLGLAIAYGTVKRIGGSIAVANGAGGGACITLRLPAGRELLAA